MNRIITTAKQIFISVLFAVLFVCILTFIFSLLFNGCNEPQETITKTVIKYDTIIQNKIIVKTIPGRNYKFPRINNVDSININFIDSSGIFRATITPDSAVFKFSVTDTIINTNSIDSVFIYQKTKPRSIVSVGMVAEYSGAMPVLQLETQNFRLMAGYHLQNKGPVIGLLIPIRIFGRPNRSKAKGREYTQETGTVNPGFAIFAGDGKPIF